VHYILTADLLLRSPGIEVAARPVLYARAAFGDTDLHYRLDALGHLTSRNCPKIGDSFIGKALSRCGSYAVDMMLLCLIYDVHICRTIYGLVRTAADRKLSPETACDHLPMFDSYWRHAEDVLVDMTRRMGYPPTVFITVAPAEWKIPALEGLFDGYSNKDFWRMQGPLTLHIHRIMMQIMHEVLEEDPINSALQPGDPPFYGPRCTPENPDRHELFFVVSYNPDGTPRKGNYVIRVEFQGRGTLHIHVAGWLTPKARYYNTTFTSANPVCNLTGRSGTPSAKTSPLVQKLEALSV
jgi:hypothetical protein